MSAARKVTAAQRRYYWLLVRELGLDDDARHGQLSAVVGKSSTKGLTEREMAAAIDALAFLAGHKAERESKYAGGLTTWQVGEIRRLERELGWSENEMRLLGFCARVTHVQSPELERYSGRHGRAIIEGLKGMLAGERRRQTRA